MQLVRGASRPVLQTRMALDLPFEVGEVMTSEVACVPPDCPAELACELMSGRGISHLLVTQFGRLAGVLCACDLWDAPGPSPVSEVMSALVLTVPATAAVGYVIELMVEQRVGCLPVLDRGQLVGIVTRGDLYRASFAGGLRRFCVACGSHHHVRSLGGKDGPLFCLECSRRESRRDTLLMGDLYTDLGGGG
jgi:CBS domain-containing protein